MQNAMIGSRRSSYVPTAPRSTRRPETSRLQHGYLYGAWKDVDHKFRNEPISGQVRPSATARLSAPTCGTTAPKLILQQGWFTSEAELWIISLIMVDTILPKSLSAPTTTGPRGTGFGLIIGLNLEHFKLWDWTWVPTGTVGAPTRCSKLRLARPMATAWRMAAVRVVLRNWACCSVLTTAKLYEYATRPMASLSARRATNRRAHGRTNFDVKAT